MNTKQVIVMRKDLKMRKGKMIAQGAHASMKVFLDAMERICIENRPQDIIVLRLKYLLDSPELEWIDGIFTKICVSVKSEEELLSVFKQACDADLPCALITDSGKTEFNGVPTHTCCAIGPWEAEEIDKITGNLSLL